MANDKQNMDNFLRESLGNLEMNPSKSVWKGVSKKLILLELIRLNFSNIGKSWLYTGVAAVTTFAGFTLYQLNQEEIPTETPNSTEIIIASETKEKNAEQEDTYQMTENDVESLEEGEIITELEPIDEINQNQGATKASIITRKSNESQVEIEPNPVVDTSKSDFDIKSKLDSNTEEKQQNIIISEEITAINESAFNEKIDSPQTQHTPKTELQNNSENKDLSNSNQSNDSEKSNLKDSSKKKKLIAPVIISDNDKNQEIENHQPSKLSWFVGANYTPEWPISSKEMYVNNHQLGLKAGMEYKKWSMSIGIGMKSEKTPSRFMAHYSTFDSVGFFYDIDYYEQVPNYADSIIIHYTTRSVFDSIHHESETKGPDQKRKWIFIPVNFSYRLYQKPKYELMAKVSANFGWSNYTEEIAISSSLSGYYQLENTTIKNNDTYLQVGIGLENNFSILPNWWIYAEPRLNYYVKSPYEIKGNSSNGPFAFGLQIGIKYKFNR